MSEQKVKILYLGQQNFDTTQHSKAANDLGAEFLQYNGNSEGELIEHLKDVDAVINQGHDFDDKLFSYMGNNGRCKGLISMGHGFEGLNISEVENIFNINFNTLFEKQIRYLKQHGLISISNNKLKLTDRGIFLSNQVFVEFI